MTLLPGASPAHYKTRITVLVAVVPLVIALIGAIVSLLWLDRLPAVVTLHWGTDLDGNEGAPPWVVPIALLGATLAVSSVLLAVLWHPGNAGGGLILRALVALPTWLVVFLTLALVGTLGEQLDTREGGDVPFPVLPLLVGLAVAFAAGAVAWVLAPAVPHTPAHEEAARAIPLAPGQRVVWTSAASAGGPVLAALLGSAGALVGLAVFVSLFLGAPAWAVFVAPAALLLAALSMSWRIRIDASGVTLRPLLGLPRMSVPLADIEEATVTTVHAVPEFGGWGVRMVPNGMGVIVRNGPALKIHRRSGRSLTVTVDDAATAAGLLEALVARSRATAV